MKKRWGKLEIIVTIIILLACFFAQVTIGDILVGIFLLCLLRTIIPYIYATLKFFHLTWLGFPLLLTFYWGFAGMIKDTMWGKIVIIVITTIVVIGGIWLLVKPQKSNTKS